MEHLHQRQRTSSNNSAVITPERSPLLPNHNENIRPRFPSYGSNGYHPIPGFGLTYRSDLIFTRQDTVPNHDEDDTSQNGLLENVQNTAYSTMAQRWYFFHYEHLRKYLKSILMSWEFLILLAFFIRFFGLLALV